MRSLLFVAGIGLSVPAGAQTLVVSGGGGFDFLTSNAVTGVDVAARHDGDRGFRFVGRATGGWAWMDMRPYGRFEAGFLGVVPTRDRAAVRVGAVAGVQIHVAPYALPFQVGGTPAADSWGHVGFFPYGKALAELGWRREAERGVASWAVGLEAGLAQSVARFECDPSIPDGCTPTTLTFHGGVVGRVRFHHGLHLELLAGPSPMLTVGYAFGGLGRRDDADDVTGTAAP